MGDVRKGRYVSPGRPVLAHVAVQTVAAVVAGFYDNVRWQLFFLQGKTQEHLLQAAGE